MSNFAVFFGGSVGSDSHSTATWSGLGPFLLNAMRGAGILDRGEGIRVSYPSPAPSSFRWVTCSPCPMRSPQGKCVSYHDGNLSDRLKSGFGFGGISRQRIDQAQDLV